MFDSVRFDQQRFNWTMKEFDRYSSAFAYGLVESGYKPGDKLVLWIDQNDSAEVLVSTMGASKAGVTIVTFSEKDSKDSLHQTLQNSKAKGLVFSPSTKVDAEGTTRADFVTSLMPELESTNPGELLSINNYPHLKQVIQSGHNGMRGVLKYKDSLVYAAASLSAFSLPQNDANDVLYECYRNG